MNGNAIRIHKPDGLHTWGIEYNWNREDLNTPAGEFVDACKKQLLTSNSDWFWQSGSDSPDSGYQFFEYMGPNPYETVVMAAKKIANMMNVRFIDNT